MYLKKKGNILISTMIILSLMLMLGNFLFHMMKNNRELEVLYKLDSDIYDMNSNEENILSEFMKRLNENIDDVDDEKKEYFNEDFIENINENILEYEKEDKKLYLVTAKGYNTSRKREIKYKIKNGKIILIPTYKFEEIENKSIENS
ncbi:hypothetical protein [Clostridium saccharobutylicum]|uniref:Uncharacterized protein n=1 Tax=Clostridium saccharobutylicum TaxID=169679 RepID=A0A1S8MYG5_CLOSA|nr:hypothetical protein [Clostridium saccharobutylicum]OOM09210.1 hypothetical protein CLOSAC_34900 [Clostridium saccharobutylicum]